MSETGSLDRILSQVDIARLAYDYTPEQQAADEAREAARLRDHMLELAPRDTGVPARQFALWRSGLAETKATAAIAEAERAGSVITVLAGPPGVGKTAAAAGWLLDAFTDPSAWASCAAGCVPVGCPSCEWVTGPQLARWPRFEAREMDRLLRSRRLVLDDMGVEYADQKGNLLAIIEELIDARYANNLPVVITCNLNAEGFASRYGQRITDRIRECGRFVGLTGKTMRGTK